MYICGRLGVCMCMFVYVCLSVFVCVCEYVCGRVFVYVCMYMLPSKWIIQELSTIPSECQQSRSVLGNVGNYLLSLESLGIVENPEVDLGNVICG